MTTHQSLILIDGMSGAGKTTTTRLLTQKLPRTAHIGMDVVKKFVSDFERGTRDNAIARTVVMSMTKTYAGLGLSVIVEQSFPEEEIAMYEHIAFEHHISCYKFQLHASPDVALQRVITRTKENNGDLPEERAKRNISLFRTREQLGFKIIDTTHLEPKRVAEKILDQLNTH